MLNPTKTAQPTFVNAIDVDALLALIESVRGDAAQRMRHWRVTSLWARNGVALRVASMRQRWTHRIERS